jgi:alkylation response protein AidB-like acyl-CoA dehydrogenase
MSLQLTPEQAGFRDAARAWLADHAPAYDEPDSHLTIFPALTPDEERKKVEASQRWQRLKHDAGFAGIAVPAELGGRGLGLLENLLFNDEESAYRLPLDALSVTMGMVLPTLVRWGTPEQRDRHVPAILAGQEVWCQLFSEPGAGSDLAALSTAAVADGDGWVVRGQKVWTSYARDARYGYLLARTDRDGPKHAGITAFRLDLTDPAVTIRPLRQATGGATFNEVFIDGARVGAADVIGEVGDGWRVAISTLMNERYALDPKVIPVEALTALVRERPRPGAAARLGEVAAAHRVVSAIKLRLLSAARDGLEPGPEGSAAKLVATDAQQVAADLAMELLGPEARTDNRWTAYAIGVPGLRIGGGTDEIMKNVIAQRVLGLPRS